ncbi:MAG: UpxY family transcription antiterminator [Terracidiphilus sp.]|jgi:transcription antitermination factor NusG
MGEACFSTEKRVIEVPHTKNPDQAWYGVQTAYRCEQRVASGLTAKGFNTYLPLLREVHQWKDRRKTIEVPAFTGYLFVHYEPSLRNRVKVLETSGIVRLLGGNHAPSPISEVEIEAVRRTLGSSVPCGRCDALTPGTLVEVTRGPLAGVQGRLARIKNNLRLIVTISVFSQAISAELSLSDVQAVQDRNKPEFAELSN